MPSRAAIASLLVWSVSLAACSSTGGASFLVLGGSGAPQEGLVARVHEAEQEASTARVEFAAAFHLYQRLTAPQAVELDELNDQFADAIEACDERARDLAKHLDALREETEELVKSWNDELERFAGETMRKKSAAMLADTEARARRALAALERVQSRMQPVQLKLQDYALFFHHNLNARAIATLQDTYKDFDAEFRALDSEFEKADTEFTAFLANFTVQLSADEAK